MTLVLPQPPSKPRPPATVLQGPADADAFRVKVGRYGDRWYTDSLPGCDIAPASEWQGPSVSQVKKAKPFEGADFVAMKRIARDQADGASMPRRFDAAYEYMKSVNKLGLDAAGRRGTHVHKMAEQMLYGLPVDADGPGAHYRGALEDFFAAYQPELICAEVVCLHRDLHGVGYGGTGDAGLRIEGDEAFIDWKSRGEDADHAAYPEEGAQLAAYVTAQYAIAAGKDGQAKRIAVPKFKHGLIISVKPDGCRVYPVDLDKAARLWESLHAWWVARLDERAPIGRPWPTKRAQTVDPVQAVLDATEHRRPTAQQTRVLAGKAPGVVATSAPRAPKPDEGEPADPQAVEALQARFKAMPDNAKLAMKRIAEEAQAADRPISVAQNPSVRRFEIARLLIGWVSYDKPKDETSAEYRQWLTESPSEDLLRDVLTLVLGTDAASQPGVPVGAAVSLLDPGTARRCTEIFDRLAAGAALSVDEAGRPVLLAA